MSLTARLGLVASALVLEAAAARAEEPAVEVEVRGERDARPAPRDPTLASTVVVGRDLARPGTSTAETLARVPGVQISRTGSSSDLATAGIRGATSAETPVYLAGIRLNDDITGIADLSTVPAFMIERVEVYRGGAPFEADRLGMGGAVFFEPRMPRRTEGLAGVGAGSFEQRAAYASAGVVGDGAAALIALRVDGAENDFGYTDASGDHTRTNADFTSEDAWSIGRYAPAPGALVTVLAHAFHREQGSPGFAVLPNDRARTESGRMLAAASARFPCGHDDVGAESCTVDAGVNTLSAFSVLSDPEHGLGTASFTATRGRRLEARARVSGTASRAFDAGGSLGLSTERARIERPGAAEQADRVTVRPAATATWRAAETTDLVVLGALECHTMDGAGRGAGACGKLEPGARAGVVHRASRSVELRANLGHTSRSPTLGELYGVSSVVRGNPSLGSESGETVDAGARVEAAWGAPHVALDTFVFARRARDLIAYRRNTIGVVVPYNVGEARVLGVEGAVEGGVRGVFRDSLSATFLDARDVTPGRGLTNDYLPFRSRLVVTNLAELYTDRGAPGLGVDAASIGVRVSHRGSRYADQGGLVVLPEATVVDVEGAVTVLGAVTARAVLKNAGDVREVDAVGLPVPGRSAYFEVEAFTR